MAKTHLTALQARPNLLHLSENTHKPIKPRYRKSLHFPPTPTVQTANSDTLTTNYISKDFTSKSWERNLREQGSQPSTSTGNSSRLASLCPERQKERKPSLPEFLVNPSQIGQNPRSPRLKEKDPGHHVRPRPLVVVNQRILL